VVVRFPVLIAGSVAIGVSTVYCTRPAELADPPARNLQGSGITKLWEQNCANCHGANGQGGGGGTRSLISVEKFDQARDKPFFDAIKKGIPNMGMDAFGASLSDPEIWGLVVHIREMQSRGLREKNGSPKPVDGVFPGKVHDYRMETVVESGLKTPWAVDWLPDGRMLITNRPGTLMLFDGGKLSEVADTPRTVEIGQGGLMDVAVHPAYAKNGWIYLGFTDPAKDGRGGMTKIVRGKLAFDSGPKWTAQETIFEAAQDTYNGSGVHFGNRIAFDGKGHVFFSIGERGSGNLAQDLSKPNGKVYRVNEDGSIPNDNPFASASDKAKGWISAIWSYGHRNPQGLAFDAKGDLWDTEHAPRGGDEVNRIEKGANYGWPIISFGINYNDTAYALPWPATGQNFKMPAFRWLPSTGACGLDLIDGAAFPKWKGDLVAGGLSGQNVDRLSLVDGKLVEREELVQGMGRVRDVMTGPEGAIYIVFNEPDKVVRLVPAK